MLMTLHANESGCGPENIVVVCVGWMERMPDGQFRVYMIDICISKGFVFFFDRRHRWLSFQPIVHNAVADVG